MPSSLPGSSCAASVSPIKRRRKSCVEISRNSGDRFSWKNEYFWERSNVCHRLARAASGWESCDVGQAMILTYDPTPIVTVYRDVVDASGEQDHVEVSGEGYATPLRKRAPGINLLINTQLQLGVAGAALNAEPFQRFTLGNLKTVETVAVTTASPHLDESRC